jgi:hypothetical protein
MGMGSSNLLELRLMHHYTKSTCTRHRSVYAGKPFIGQILWEVDIPQVAFSSEIVLNALLGISAWHLWSLSPSDQALAKASRSYFGKALVLQITALKQGDSQDIVCLSMAGIVLAHHCWLLSHGGDHHEPYRIPLETYYLCAGFKALAEKASPPFSIYASLGDYASDRQPKESPHRYPYFWNRAMEDMNLLFERVKETDLHGIDKQLYRKVAEEIKSIYSLLSDGLEETSVIEYAIATILQRVPLPFLNLLERKDPLAMALIARDLALLALLSGTKSWWIHGDGQWRVEKCSVRGIQSIMPLEWLWTMEWPLKIISGDIELI